MKVSTVFKLAYHKIKDPECWVQQYAAVDAMGIPVNPSSADARKWCAVGALMAVSTGERARYSGLVAGLARVCECSVSSFNDSHSHAEVLDVYRKAYQQARRAEAILEHIKKGLPWKI